MPTQVVASSVPTAYVQEQRKSLELQQKRVEIFEKNCSFFGTAVDQHCLRNGMVKKCALQRKHKQKLQQLSVSCNYFYINDHLRCGVGHVVSLERGMLCAQACPK